MLELNKLYCMDCMDGMKEFTDGIVNCCVTSPPYFGLRDYKVDGQIGLEQTPEEYVAKLVDVFREVRRVLRDDGTLWLNLGDSYAGSGKGSAAYPEHAGDKQGSNKGTVGCRKITAVHYDREPKNLLGIPWRVAFALQADGWYLRSDIIWAKTNPMPESVKDRPTKAHEYVFLLSKSPKYYFDCDAIREPCTESSVADFMRRKTLDNKGGGHGSFEDVRPDLCRRRSDYYASDFKRHARDVWIINTKPYRGAHFATFPEELAERCILAGCPARGTVLDPFMGSGTTAKVALENGRNYIGFELNPDYVKIAEKRLVGTDIPLPLETV